MGAAGRALGIDLIRYVGQVAFLTGLATSGLYEVKASHLLWIFALTAILGALPGLPHLPRLAWKRRQIRAVMREHWHFGKWLLGSVLMSWAQRSIFQIAAGMLLGAGAVGGLRAAQMLLGPAQIFIQALENFVPVEAARRYAAGGREALDLYLRLVAGVGGLVVFATSLVFLVAPGLWLQFLYGSDFIGYGHLVYWHFISYLVAFVGVPLGAGLRALNYTMPLFYSYGIAMVVASLSAYPLTWAFGTSGNAFGTALATLVNHVILWRSFRHKLAAAAREAD
jgi:O-antigen/teichoic acid export membrane protein